MTFATRLAAIAVATFLALGPVLPQAQAAPAEMRLVYLASDPSEGLGEAIDPALSVLHLPTVPLAAEAGSEVLAAMLRASPVSTLAAGPDGLQAEATDLYLVTDMALAADATGALVVRAATGDVALPDYLGRVEAVLAALSPRARQIAFFRVSDPDGVVPGALDGLRQALGQSGFALSVVTVGPDAATCGGPRVPHHLAVLGGVPDRAPFGDADGLASSAEVRAWMAAAIERGRRRAEPCAADYGFLLLGNEDPAVTLVAAPARSLVPGIDSTVYMETFEAVFLQDSEDPAEIAAFLDRCIYCPGEASLTERLRDIADRAVVLELETSVWSQIAADTAPARIAAYLDNCRLCAFAPEAEGRLAEIAAADAARAAETEARDGLIAARDLAGLRAWLDTCIACDGREAVVAFVTEFEADEAYQAELAALDMAIAAQNGPAINGWLASCQVCDGRDRAQAALDDLVRQEAALAPCIAAAGLPQAGGPRLLTEIDIPAATAACSAVLTQFPGSPVATTLMGRVALAGGDVAGARTAYETGMAANVPAAFGLAAHESYAPTDGTAPDFARSEALGQQGLAMGDWLSAEVLTVLYSNELIAGKTAADAFAIATANAAEGNPVAQFFEGYFHQNGLGTAASAPLAVAAYQRAVDQDYLHAASFLAEIYERGAEGVEVDPLKAADLYWAALEGKDPTALDRLTAQVAGRDAAVVREVQSRLQEAGFFNGRIDGIAGPNTIEAVREFVLGEVVVE